MWILGLKHELPDRLTFNKSISVCPLWGLHSRDPAGLRRPRRGSPGGKEPRGAPGGTRGAPSPPRTCRDPPSGDLAARPLPRARPQEPPGHRPPHPGQVLPKVRVLWGQAGALGRLQQCNIFLVKCIINQLRAFPFYWRFLGKSWTPSKSAMRPGRCSLHEPEGRARRD